MNIDRIKLDKKVLKTQQVGLVLIFGSQVNGYTHPNSDIDIGIVFMSDEKRKKKPVEVYGELYEEFTKKFKTKNIDIVYLKETPLSLQHKALENDIILYQDPDFILPDYKEEVMKRYFDFKFFENIFNQAVIGRSL